MSKKIIRRVANSYGAIKQDIINTPLEINKRLSSLYNTNIYYKREDLQITRSFKLRGSLNKIKKIKENTNGLICASAGNHAQGFAYSCNKLNLNGTIYVPQITPSQKLNRIRYYGKDNITIKLYGNNFQECLDKAVNESNETKQCFVHPFDDYDIINGQATIAYEIYKNQIPDFIICPVGGGGLISGISQYSKIINPNCIIIGVEPENANSLTLAIQNNKPTLIENIDTFVDGASVPIIGNKTFEISRDNVDKIYTISKGKICHDIINCYQDDGIILEPAGALPISCLDYLKQDYNLNGKNVVIIVSGGNNDVTRYNEIMKLNLEYMGLVHYFVIEFNQVPNQLRQFINNILDENSDIIRFEYIKKTNSMYGNVLIGIQLSNKNKLDILLEKLNNHNIKYNKIEQDDLYYDILI